MWISIFVCLYLNVLLIKCEDNNTVTIIIKEGENCTILSPAYTFTEGNNITLHTETKQFIKANELRCINLSGTQLLLTNFTKKQRMVLKKSDEGIWVFKYLYLKDNVNYNRNALEVFDDHNYTELICSTNVTIASALIKNTVDENNNKYIIIVCIVCVIAVVIITIQTGYILHLKKKAKALDRHNNLLKKSECIQEIDRARYCADPGKKIAKVPQVIIGRESCIYEAPNIELPDNPPLSTLPPPLPCTPRPDRNAGKQSYPTFPRTKQPEHELNLANRAPLPLPPQNERFEGYEEMAPIEENTYEPPPMNTLPQPQRPTFQQKKIPKPTGTGSRLEIPTDTIKFRMGSKPPVTPKPQGPRPNNTLKVSAVNELEQVFMKRNVRVPIQTIPDNTASRVLSPKSGPPTVINSKPTPHHQPQHVMEEEIYYNELLNSSDEEWTYEPLKPASRYNMNK